MILALATERTVRFLRVLPLSPHVDFVMPRCAIRL
jgi:hypothetical protein